MAIVHVTQTNFQQEVMDHKGVVMIDFYADWCGPCKIMHPILEELSNEMGNVKFVKINVDETQEIPSQYSVFSIPTFLLFKDGKVVGQFVGAQSKESVKEEVQKAVNA